MTTLIVTIHIVACVALIALVLLQSGKEGMGVIFGGGSQSVFGSTGAGGLLVKLSAIFGALFLITSLAYNYFAGAERRPAEESVMVNVNMEEPQAPPAAVAPETKPEVKKEGTEAATAPAEAAKQETPAVEQKAAPAENAAPADNAVAAPEADKPAAEAPAQDKKEAAPAQ